MSRQTTTRRRHGVRRMSERKRLTITAITAVLALVTVVICALSGVFNFHKGNERILPNLVGQTEESAKTQLAELDAEPSITYENSDETKGIVIRQDVNEGTQLKHRQTVAFVVSLGPKEQPAAPEDTPVAIPSFVGLTLEQAQATAKSLGVTVEAGGTVYDDNVRKGSVARQNPVGGTMVKPGTTIQVSISAGRRRRSIPSPSRAAPAAASARAEIRKWPRAAACRSRSHRRTATRLRRWSSTALRSCR